MTMERPKRPCQGKHQEPQFSQSRHDDPHGESCVVCFVTRESGFGQV